MSKKLKDNEARIAYKSRIKISKDQKILNNHSIFVINQLYNFAIEYLYNEKNQLKLVELGYGEFIKYDENDLKFIIIKESKIRNIINEEFKKHANKRKLNIKGLSKPIQLKLEDFLSNFNKIYLSKKKNHQFKTTSELHYGSYTTDSSIKLRKVKAIKKTGKKYTRYYIKIGKEEYEFKNNKMNIKHFKIKNVTISRKNSKYYVSISGIKKIKRTTIVNILGLDANFEEMVCSNGFVFETNNMANKLNLFTEELTKLKQKSSEIVEINKKVLKTICKTNKISVYKGKKLTKEAKSLYREILSKDKKYQKLQKQINNLYEKRTNVQNDLYNKISSKIANITDLCFIEDLSIEGMIESKNVRNDNLYNAALQKFLTILSNKLHSLGKVCLKVDPRFTTKKCSTIGCNYIYKDMDLGIREWYCDRCDTIHHRDINSSWNIIYAGIEEYLRTQGDEYKFSIQLNRTPVLVTV